MEVPGSTLDWPMHSRAGGRMKVQKETGCQEQMAEQVGVLESEGLQGH